MSDNDSEQQPNLAAFFLVVGGVTCVFLALFQLTLPRAIANLLSQIVIGVTIISVIIGFILEALGYFGDPEIVPEQGDNEDGEETTAPSSAEWVPDGGSEPLPPLINFDDELAELHDYFDGEFPEEMQTFLDEYRRLKTTSPKERDSVASDLRAALNPVPVLVDDAELEAMVDNMGDDLFTYVETDGQELLDIESYGFYDNGKEQRVTDVQGEKVRVKARVRNRGESMKTDVVIRWLGPDDVQVKHARLPLGEIPPATSKELNTHVYVPSVAERAEFSAVPAAAPREVLDM